MSFLIFLLLLIPLFIFIGSRLIEKDKGRIALYRPTLFDHPKAPLKLTTFPTSNKKDKTKICYIVTGGCGFLGSVIVEGLLARGEKRIIVFDMVEELPEFLTGRKEVIFIKGNLVSLPSVRNVLVEAIMTFEDQEKGWEYVIVFFHVAALVDYWRRLAFEWPRFEQVNVTGTQNVVNASKELLLRTDILQSSSSSSSSFSSSSSSCSFDLSSLDLTIKIVGMSSTNIVINPRTPIQNGDESLPYATTPCAHYGRSKRIAEEILRQANQSKIVISTHPTIKRRLCTGCIRTHGLFGPKDTFITERIHESRLGVCLATPGTKIDWVYVENAAHGLLCLEHNLGGVISDSNDGQGPIYFISNAEPLDYQEFHEGLISSLLEMTSKERSVRSPIRNVSTPIPYHVLLPFGWLIEGVVWITGNRIWKWAPRKASIALTLTPATLQATLHTCWFNIRKAKEELGFTPLYTMSEAFKRCAVFYSDLYNNDV